jgi:predicted phosphodiesterase
MIMGKPLDTRKLLYAALLLTLVVASTACSLNTEADLPIAETIPALTDTPVADAMVQTDTPAVEPPTQVPEPTETAVPTSTGRQVRFEQQIAAFDFILPLTIQHITSDGAWLFFEMESPVAGEVFYWIDGMQELGVRSVEFDASTSQHIIELPELQPDTFYRVRVGLQAESGNYRSPGLNGEVWGETLLKTYPEKLEHLRVAVIGDSGFGESVTYALAAQMAARNPDFVIHTGDIVYSAYENGSALGAYQAKYFWPFQKVLLQAPVYAVPGNHEYYSDASVAEVPYYFYVFPSVQEFVQDGSWVGSGKDFRNWFAVRLMDYQFLFLESQSFYLSGDVSEQTEWMRQVLEEHDGPSVVTYHIATYTSGRHENDGSPIRSAWVPYFREAFVPLILSGHDHNYERLRIDGIEYVVSGGGSRKLYGMDAPVEGSQLFAAESHFVLLDLYADRIEIESVNAFGDVIDKHTLVIAP